MRIETLQQFYDIMNISREIRERIVSLVLKGKDITSVFISKLYHAVDILENIPELNGRRTLSTAGGKVIYMDLTYEIEELKKDIYFLEHSEDEFYSYLEGFHAGFDREVMSGIDYFNNIRFRNFITDRDGTINNYCGRYRSSVQSVYNALFLIRFAKSRTQNAVILTSAPLENGGLLNISIDPENIFILAGSKGREYINTSCIRGYFPIGGKKQKKLNILNKKLSMLIKKTEYEIFSLIGSGLQFKFGQTTIARQDIYNSISTGESENFLNTVIEIVNETDPEGKYFRIEDTGKDIEIVLTVESGIASGNLKDFDKGDGVQYLDRTLELGLMSGSNLICGDTGSDVPMVAYSAEKTKSTFTIFVTEDRELRERVLSVCGHSFFVRSPDALVAILNLLGKRGSM
jgi:hypothetical protein